MLCAISVQATQSPIQQPALLQSSSPQSSSPQSNPQTIPQRVVQPVPQRIVSLNLCVDQLLWQLVPHDRLASISYLSAEPLWSPIAAYVEGIHLNHGLAEEIIPLRADKILAMPFDSPASVQLLQRLGAPVDMVMLPGNLAEIPQQIAQLGSLVGADQNAQVLVANVNRQLQALDQLQRDTHARTAFWYSSNGVVIGIGTMEHELMNRAGLRNLAAERGMTGFMPLDIELLIAAKPHLLIVEESSSDVYSLAREYLAHPALTKNNFQIIRLPAGLSGCASSTVGEVAEVLRRELHSE